MIFGEYSTPPKQKCKEHNEKRWRTSVGDGGDRVAEWGDARRGSNSDATGRLEGEGLVAVEMCLVRRSSLFDSARLRCRSVCAPCPLGLSDPSPLASRDGREWQTSNEAEKNPF